jgi:2-C-methyl-D-erythritol 4-phosphate cytidylyltransferase
MNVFVLVAAGEGRRLGSALPKALVELAGKTLLQHALEALLADEVFSHGVVVVPPGLEGDSSCLGAAAAGGACSLALVPGGRTRQDSVRLGVTATPKDAEVVLIHDAARPLVSTKVIADCVRTAHSRGAATAVVDVTDTVKEVEPNGTVVRTHDRSRLRLVQTPQAFRRSILVDAHERALAEKYEATDDAALVERYGLTVWTVPGDADNLKITTARDLAWAEWYLRSRAPR